MPNTLLDPYFGHGRWAERRLARKLCPKTVGYMDDHSRFVTAFGVNTSATAAVVLEIPASSHSWRSNDTFRLL